MTLKRGPLTVGLLAVTVGVVVLTAFSTTDPFALQAQLGMGGLAIAIGLYFILVAWREQPVNQMTAPSISTLIRREARGRFMRTFATGASVAIVVGALFATTLLTSGAVYSVNQVRNRLGADLVVLPRGSNISPQPFYTLVYTPGSAHVNRTLASLLAALPGVEEVSPQLYLTEFSPGGCGLLDKVYLIAADPQSNFMLKSWLPGNVTQPLLTGTRAVVGYNVPAFYLLQDQGKFYGTQLEVQARLPATGTFVDHVIFISFSTADTMLRWQTANTTTTLGQAAQKSYNYWLPPLSFHEGQASAFFVKLQDGTSADAAATKVQSTISNVHAFTSDSIIKSASVRYSGLLSTFSLSGTLVWLGALLLVSTITYLAVNERKGEIGLIRAVGAPRKFVRRLIISQTILLTTISGLVGIVAAWIIFNWFLTSIIMTVGLPFSVPPPLQLAELVAFSTALSALTGTLASLWPARVVARMEPYEAARLIVR